jgi:hypothetical protein
MEGVPPKWTTRKLLDTLVGLELGIIGGVVMLLWFAASSPVLGQSWWTVPNLFASHFYSGRAVRFGPGWITVVGSAVHLVLSGLIGAISGFALTPGRFLGIATGIAWYLLCYLVFWRRAAPMLITVGYQPALAIAYLLFGSALGWHHAMISFVLEQSPHLPWEKTESQGD